MCTGGEQSIDKHEATGGHTRNTPNNAQEEEDNIQQNQRTIQQAIE